MLFHVIMPIGSDPEYNQKKKLISKSASKAGITVHFPDYCQVNPDFDLSATLKDLNSSHFVLADLSLERPSCYYELGLAQAMDKKIHMIAACGTPIHQTYRRNEVNFYDNLDEMQSIVSKVISIEVNNQS